MCENLKSLFYLLKQTIVFTEKHKTQLLYSTKPVRIAGNKLAL